MHGESVSIIKGELSQLHLHACLTSKTYYLSMGAKRWIISVIFCQTIKLIE